MGFLSKLFGESAAAPIEAIGNAVDKLSTSAEEKAQLRLEAARAMIEAQSSVLVAEAQAKGLAALWRPLTMLSFAGLLWWFVLASTFGWRNPDLSGVPAELWDLMMLGLGGYVGGR